ncbi:class A beta-lactamase [Sphingomonas cavernae]|nr:class A beta-lactamase [Sphingomonas cavernae]
MKKPFSAFALPALLLSAAWAAPAAAQPETPRVPAIEQQVTRLGQGSGGVVGVAAWRLDGKGPRVLVNADQAFPMASTFKVAVAAKIFDRVDKGELRLEQMLDVPSDMIVPSEVIADRLIHPGISLSIYNLLELMLTQSDNTATDVLTKAAGGPAVVTAWLRGQGVTGQRVDRDTAGLLREFYGVGPGPLGERFAAAAKTNPALLGKSSQPDAVFDEDPRDTSTPTAMATLLTRIFSGKALSAQSTKALIGIMERCRTGGARLRGKLPPGTVVANKTGTIGGTVNDTGVITLPGDAGQIAIAVYVKKSAAPMADRERAIAEIARSVHDFYLFSAPAK